jgi:hypothetical protein
MKNEEILDKLIQLMIKREKEYSKYFSTSINEEVYNLRVGHRDELRFLLNKIDIWRTLTSLSTDIMTKMSVDKASQTWYS